MSSASPEPPAAARPAAAEGGARPGAVRALGLAGAWAALFGWCLRPEWGIDVFFHVAIGRAVLAGGIPTTDVLSAAHPDAPWTPFQLGYELLVALIDGAAGLDGLRVLHAAVFATGFLLAALRFRRLAGSRAAAAALTLLLLALFEERLRMRPHAFNLLLEAAVLLPLAAGRWRDAPRRARWIVLGVAALWSFIHAMGALWLLAVVGTFVVAGRDAAERRHAALALALGAAAVLLTPGALPGILHVLRIQGQWRPFVPELAPSWAWLATGTPLGVLSALAPWAAVAAVLAAALGRPPRERWPTLLAAAGLAAGAVAMVRLGYYAAFAVALVAPDLAPAARRLLPAPRARAAAASALAAALAALLVAHVAPRWRAAFPWTTTLQPGAFPVAEARALRDAGVRARIFNEPAWGGYLLYVLHPGSTVLSDGRVTFLPDVAELLRADERAEGRVAAADAAFARYGVDLLVRARGVFPGSADWELLLRGPVADVWSRAGAPAEARKQALGRVLGAPARPAPAP